MAFTPPLVQIRLKLSSLLARVFHRQQGGPFPAQGGRKGVLQPKSHQLVQPRGITMRQIPALMPSLETSQRVRARRRRGPATLAGDQFAHTRVMGRPRRSRLARWSHAIVNARIRCGGKHLRTGKLPRTATGPRSQHGQGHCGGGGGSRAGVLFACCAPGRRAVRRLRTATGPPVAARPRSLWGWRWLTRRGAFCMLRAGTARGPAPSDRDRSPGRSTAKVTAGVEVAHASGSPSHAARRDGARSAGEQSLVRHATVPGHGLVSSSRKLPFRGFSGR